MNFTLSGASSSGSSSNIGTSARNVAWYLTWSCRTNGARCVGSTWIWTSLSLSTTCFATVQNSLLNEITVVMVETRG